MTHCYASDVEIGARYELHDTYGNVFVGTIKISTETFVILKDGIWMAGEHGDYPKTETQEEQINLTWLNIVRIHKLVQ